MIVIYVETIKNLKKHKQRMLYVMYISFINAFECILDKDCKTVGFSELTDRFCVNHRCIPVKPPYTPCTHPNECSSYSYYGPLACSAKCGSKNECGHLLFAKTAYCCKAIPLKGKCNAQRPRSLSGCSKSQSCLTANNISKCSENTESSWFLGALLSILGNVLINLGVNYQKLSYTKREMLFLEHRFSTLYIGLTIYFLGKISSFSAYIFCNQSILAGLSSTGLISNSLLAPYINNESFTIFDLIAFVFVVIGSTILIYNTGKTHTTYTICELLKMLKKQENILWLGFIFISIFLLYLTIQFVEVNSSRCLVHNRFEFLKSDFIHFEENEVVMKYCMVLIYVFLSSFIASFTTLSIKILGQIVNRYVNHGGGFLSFTTLFFGTTLVSCTLLQIYWTNRALMYYDALVVIPIFHMSWTVLSIVTAGIYFQDFESFSNNQMHNFLIGIIIIFCGSFFLGWKIKNKNVIESRELDTRED